MKKPLLPAKYILPIGLLLSSAGIVLNQLMPSLPEFVRGFLMGLGITLVIAGFVIQRKLAKRSGNS